MPLRGGSSAGPYEIQQVLGAGAMGTVYLARDTRLGRLVALKVLHQDNGDHDAQRRRLLHEARAASSLNHPNICQIFDVGETDGDAWIAMEYVPGQSLDAAIPPAGLPPWTTVRLGVQLADALSHAHGRGLLHRDFKTANIVCAMDGRPKVLDFGLAAALPDTLGVAVTRSESAVAADPAVAGTISYMAPEVLRGETADERSDLWSLGVVLYEMASGARPFKGRTPFHVAAAILEQPPAPLPPHVPAALTRAVLRLLQKDPHERYARASEVKAVLESIAGEGQPDDERPSTPAPTARTWRWIAAAAALLAIAAIVVELGRRSVGLSIADQHLASTFSGSHRAPSYSPDGSMIAFSAPDANNVEQIWIQGVSQTLPLQITSMDADASRPRWSPKNDQIVFGIEGRGIWSVSPLGGNARRLLERGANPNFSRDGARLVYERDFVIWTANFDGSDARRVAGVSPHFYDVPDGPAFSPDGRSIAYFQAHTGPLGDLWAIEAAGGTPRQLTSDLTEAGWPVWTPDGRTIVFSSARAGSRTLWQIPGLGGTPTPLTTGAGEDDQPDISADGRHLAYANTRSRWELRIRDLAADREHTVFSRPIPTLFPMFSPDGTRILFFGYADNAVAIFTVAADGSDLRQLTAGREVNHEPRWSPDGQSIYFFQSRPTDTFRRIPAEGGPSTEFRPWKWETENAPFFDPTGTFVAYTRQPAPGAPPGGPRQATIIEDVRSGSRRELPGEHMHVRGWSADGRSLLGERHDGNVWVCAVATGDCRAIGRGRNPIWSADERRVFVLRPLRDPSAPQEVWSMNMDGTDERLVATLGRFRGIDRFFDLSKDGRLVWSPFMEGRHEVWTAALLPHR
jgi:serine/threonine protein kinase